MRAAAIPTLALFAAAIAVTTLGAADQFRPETIIAIERAALDRYGNGDPQGFLEIMAADVTHFGPFVDKRVDGLEAMKALLLPATGAKSDRYEMIDPKVQRLGEMAVLTFKLVFFGKSPNGAVTTSRWNATEVFGRIDGKWKILHRHWSFTKPELK